MVQDHSVRKQRINEECLQMFMTKTRRKKEEGNRRNKSKFAQQASDDRGDHESIVIIVLESKRQNRELFRITISKVRSMK